MQLTIHNAHMPFMIHHRKRDWLLFCRGELMEHVFGESRYEYRAWSLHCCDLAYPELITRVQTSFPDRGIECNPCACMRGPWLSVTFAATDMIANEPTRYQLWNRQGPDLGGQHALLPIDTLNEPLFNGFENNVFAAFCMKTHMVIMRPATKQRWQIEFDCDEVLRVCYLPEDETRFIITCLKNNVPCSLLFDAKERAILGEIVLPSGEPVYKCAILGDDLAYVVKGAGAAEDREIRLGSWELQSTDMDIETTTKPWARARGLGIPIYRDDLGETEPYQEPRGPFAPPPVTAKEQRMLDSEIQARRIASMVAQLPDDGNGPNHWIRGVVGQCQKMAIENRQGSCADKRAFRHRMHRKIIEYWREYGEFTTAVNVEGNES